MKKTILIVLTVSGLALLYACKKDKSLEDAGKLPPVRDYNLMLKFRAKADTNLLHFDSVYTNFFDETYKVSKFRFYIHNIRLFNTDSSYEVSTGKTKHYLIDFADSATALIKLTVRPYVYNRIGLTIGVDSVLNVSGAQSGDLDPAKGMFWTWNSGYIMAKLEGTSPAANVAGNKFEYHIGGFSGVDNTLRSPVLLFPFGQTVQLKKDGLTELVIDANAAAWFYNPHDISIAQHPVITTPGPLARQMADNYSKMFTVISVLNQ